MHLGILENLRCFLFVIVHLLCNLRWAIECLKYWTQGDSDKLSMGFPCARSIVVFSTQETVIAISQGNCESNTGVCTHIVRDQNHATELLDMLPNLIKRKKWIIRIALEHSRLKAVVCCLWVIGHQPSRIKRMASNGKWWLRLRWQWQIYDMIK